MKGCGATLLAGAVLGVTSAWHAATGGWGPLVALALVVAGVAVAYGISRRGEQ